MAPAQATIHRSCVLHAFLYDDFNVVLNTDRELAVGLLWGMLHTMAERLRATNDKVTAMFAMAQF